MVDWRRRAGVGVVAGVEEIGSTVFEPSAIGPASAGEVGIVECTMNPSVVFGRSLLGRQRAMRAWKSPTVQSGVAVVSMLVVLVRIVHWTTVFGAAARAQSGPILPLLAADEAELESASKDYRQSGSRQFA